MPTSSRREDRGLGSRRLSQHIALPAPSTDPGAEHFDVPLSTRTTRERMRRLKVTAAVRDETLQEIVNAAIDHYLEHLTPSD